MESIRSGSGAKLLLHPNYISLTHSVTLKAQQGLEPGMIVERMDSLSLPLS